MRLITIVVTFLAGAALAAPVVKRDVRIKLSRRNNN